MSRFAPAHRSDGNKKEIVAALESKGWDVFDTGDVGNGFPDLVVRHPYLHKVVLVEVKTKTGKLEPKQQRLIADGWPIVVVRNVEEALAL